MFCNNCFVNLFYLGVEIKIQHYCTLKFENTSYTPRGAKFIQYLTLLRHIHVYITVLSAANLKKNKTNKTVVHVYFQSKNI